MPAANCRGARSLAEPSASALAFDGVDLNAEVGDMWICLMKNPGTEVMVDKNTFRTNNEDANGTTMGLAGGNCAPKQTTGYQSPNESPRRQSDEA